MNTNQFDHGPFEPVHYDDLRHILSRDPALRDGEPTPEDYVNFDMWVIRNYGRDALHQYINTNWDTK